MTRLLAVLLLALLVPTAVKAAENYCRDPEAEAQWLALLEKNPADLAVQTLHALRVGLCLKVDRGDLSLEQATDIFESARKVLIDQRGWEQLDESHIGERL